MIHQHHLEIIKRLSVDDVAAHDGREQPSGEMAG
jgi:hypothetical protein